MPSIVVTRRPRPPAHPRLPDFSDGHGGRLLSRLKDQPQKLGLAASNRHTTIISLDVVAMVAAAAVFILASSISAAGLGLNPSQNACPLQFSRQGWKEEASEEVH